MGVRWWVVGPVEYIILIYVLNRFSNGAYFLKNNLRYEKFEQNLKSEPNVAGLS